MINKDLLNKKLEDLDHYRRALEQHQNKAAPEILGDETLLHAIERLFQLAVDTMVDINTHIIAETESMQTADDYQSTFITLAEHDLLPTEFALRLAPVVGLRNRLVHKYEELDLKRFLHDLGENINDFKEFMRQIKKYMDKHS